MEMTIPSGAWQASAPGATAQGRPLRRGPLYDRFGALGARFVNIAGWQVADVFRSPEPEVSDARSGVGLIDLSHIGKLRLLGCDAAARLGGFIPGGEVPPPNRAQRLGEGDKSSLILGLAADEFLLLTAPNAVDNALEELPRALRPGDECAHLADITSSLVCIGIVGPRSEQLLRGVTSLDVRPSRFPDGACAQGSVAKLAGTLVHSDLGDLPAYRLLTSRAYGEYVWDMLWLAGDDLGVTQVGDSGWKTLVQCAT